MSFPSLIFWAVFAIPLIGFMVWILKQDKRKGVTGIIVLAIVLIVGITYMYIKTGGK